MIDAKIQLTKHIINSIQSDRMKKNITAAELSEAIGRTPSYISSLENGRIARIASNDLISIFTRIFGYSQQASLDYVVSLVDQSNKLMTNSTVQPTKILTYEELDKIVNIESYTKIINNINRCFGEFYNFNQKLAFLKLNAIHTNLKFDTGLMFSMMSLPFTDLDACSLDDRKHLIEDVKHLIEKYTGKSYDMLDQKDNSDISIEDMNDLSVIEDKDTIKQ